jgi:hypothetical protein
MPGLYTLPQEESQEEGQVGVIQKGDDFNPIWVLILLAFCSILNTTGKGTVMEERRKVKRRYLLYYVRIYDAKKSEQIGHLVDITEHGAMVLTEHPLPVNQVYHLRLELTSDVAEKQYLDFTAQSIWCQPDIDPHYHNTGFEIKEIAAEDVDIIRKIIATYGFRDNQTAPVKK